MCCIFVIIVLGEKEPLIALHINPSDKIYFYQMVFTFALTWYFVLNEYYGLAMLSE